MSAYIKLSTNEYPRHQGDIRLEYPDMGEEFVCPDTYALVAETPYPQAGAGQIVEELFPQQIDGVWTQVFNVRPLNEQELQARAAAEAQRLEMNRQMLESMNIQPNPDINNPGTAPEVIG
jgi:hypothetical protein